MRVVSDPADGQIERSLRRKKPVRAMSADIALTATAAPPADWTTLAFHGQASRFATAIATRRRWHRGHVRCAVRAAAPLPQPALHGTRRNATRTAARPPQLPCRLAQEDPLAHGLFQAPSRA